MMLAQSRTVLYRVQAGEEPPGVRTAEAARRKAIAAGDAEWQRRTEAQLLCAVLDAQFGAAALDKSGGAVLLQARPPQPPSCSADGNNTETAPGSL